MVAAALLGEFADELADGTKGAALPLIRGGLHLSYGQVGLLIALPLFAGSLLEFSLMEQAVRFDRLVVARTLFESEQMELDWSLLLVPTGDSLEAIAAALSEPKTT